MLCVCVDDVMDVVFSVCIVRRGAVGARVWEVGVFSSCRCCMFVSCVYNKVGLDVVSLSGWFVVCVIVSVDNERNIEVS